MKFFSLSLNRGARLLAVAALLGLATVGTSCGNRNDGSSFLPDDEFVQETAEESEGEGEEATVDEATPAPEAQPEATPPANAKVEVLVDAERSRIEITTEASAFDGFATDVERNQAKQTKVVRGNGSITRKGIEDLTLAAPTVVEFLWTDARLDESAAEAFETLAKAPRLKKVRLTGLTDGVGAFPRRVLTALSATPSLVDLDVSGSAATAADLASVDFGVGFARLERLNLYGVQVGDAGVDAILPLANRLVWLNLDDAGITSASAPKIAQFQKLTFLHVGRSQVDDGALKEFAKLTELEKIHVTRSNATEEGAEELRRALPNCVVVSQPEN